MKIVNNMKKELTGQLTKGEIIKGSYSGDYYMVLEDTRKALNLNDLCVASIESMSYKRTSITSENITITFA
jgi:hypothetical protein